MRRAAFVTAIVLWTVSALHAQNLPKARVQDLAGNTVQSETWIDNETPFVLSFWSSTCKPCIQELDLMSENLEEWCEQTPFRVIAVSVDDSRSVARARSLAIGRGWDEFTLAFDVNSDFRRAMNITSVPRVFVFDKDGRQVYMHTGYKPGDEYEVLKAVRKLGNER